MFPSWTTRLLLAGVGDGLFVGEADVFDEISFQSLEVRPVRSAVTRV